MTKPPNSTYAKRTEAELLPPRVAELVPAQAEQNEWSALSEIEQRLRTLFDYASEAIVILDVETGRFIDANSMAEQLFGLSREELFQVGLFALSPASQPDGPSLERGKEKIAEAVNGDDPVFEWWHRNARGERFPCEVRLAKVPWRNRELICGTIVDISARKQLELSELVRRQVLDGIACGVSLNEALDFLVRTIETLFPGMICSILLLDHETNCLRLCAAPSLPDVYNAAVDGLKIGPAAGSCGAAAFTGQRVIVSDVSTHPNWAGVRQLAKQSQLKACWSEPVISLSGRVLGTFAMYYREPREPAPVELHAIEAAAQMAAIVIDHERARQSLHEMNNALENRVAQETKRLSEANQQLVAAAQDARLAAVAFDTHDSIVITDKKGKILRVNQSFTELTGYAPEDVIGKTPRVLRSGRHGKEFYREMWRAIHTEGYWQGEIWNKRKDGHVYLQRLTITSAKNELGETTHFVGDGQDLTSEKQAEADRAGIHAAHLVQQSLFPSYAPELPGFDVAGAVYTAEHASGDFFDYIPLGQNSVGVLVADVSSHGLGPALLMAQTQAYLHALAESYADPGELLTQVNRMCTTSEHKHFVTMFLARLDAQTRSFVYASAGHRGYLISSNCAVQWLESPNIPLGIQEITAISSAPAIVLKPGDTLVLPTDGIEEARSPDGRLFGQERIFDVVRNNRNKSAAKIVDALFCAARDFADHRPRADDITAVVVKVLDSQ